MTEKAERVYLRFYKNIRAEKKLLRPQEFQGKIYRNGLALPT